MSGYQLRPFTAEERRQSDRWACLARGCRERPTYATRCRYVVGSRETWTERRVCDEHAARFAARHGVLAQVGAS